MNAKVPITESILEQYCLGLLPPEQAQGVERQARLHPEVQQEVDRFMEGLEQRLHSQLVKPPEELKKQTLDLLRNLKKEQEGSLNDAPVLNKYSDYENWLRLVKSLLPPQLAQPMFTREIRNDAEVFQTIIWTAVDYPDEVHTDVQECFIILEGRCRCFIDGEAIELGPGGFLDIPLHKHHNVKVLESPVLAVMQRSKVA